MARQDAVGWASAFRRSTIRSPESLGLGRARGALVAGIDEKGPARPAGIRAGDVIVRFDGQDVRSSTDLPRIVAATPVGKEVNVTVMRGGKEENLKVTLGRLEDGERQASLGRRHRRRS